MGQSVSTKVEFTVDNKLTLLMFKQFEEQKDEYLGLLRDIEQTKTALATSAERLTLLQRLLALDGRHVALPNEVSVAEVAPKKKTA
jgi:hypothetical protein